jgi:RNA recognition motif-containing protein
MANKLFVGNLSWGTTDDGLREFFAQFGNVISATIIKDRNTGRAKGFGFVEFETEEEANKAKEEGNGKELDGRPVAVHDARPQEPRPQGGGFGGGNRGGFDRRDNRGGGRRDDRRDRRDQY